MMIARIAILSTVYGEYPSIATMRNTPAISKSNVILRSVHGVGPMHGRDDFQEEIYITHLTCMANA